MVIALIVTLGAPLCRHCPNAGSVGEENEINTQNKTEVSKVKKIDGEAESVPVASSARDLAMPNMVRFPVSGYVYIL